MNGVKVCSADCFPCCSQWWDFCVELQFLPCLLTIARAFLSPSLIILLLLSFFCMHFPLPCECFCFHAPNMTSNSWFAISEAIKMPSHGSMSIVLGRFLWSHHSFWLTIQIVTDTCQMTVSCISVETMNHSWIISDAEESSDCVCDWSWDHRKCSQSSVCIIFACLVSCSLCLVPWTCFTE